MKLVLGVVDLAYSDAGGGATTTGDVAEILEAKYHIMDIFAIEREQKLGEWIADALSDQIKDIAAGAPVPNNPFQDAEEKIRASFQKFLSDEEMGKIHPEVPTQAALEGRTKRRKNQKGPRRPSFIDTGLYQQSFRAWVEQPPIGSGMSSPAKVAPLPGLWKPTF